MIIRSHLKPLPLDTQQMTVSAYLARAAERFGDGPALITTDGRTFTFRQVWHDGLCVGRFLQDQGIQPGERIAILSANVPEYLVAFQGAMHAGAVVTTLNPLYKPHEVVTQLQDCEASAVFVMGLLAPTFEAIRDQLPQIRHVWAMEDLWPMAQEAPPEPAPVPGDPAASLVSLPYSSGTTGLPKGVMISHANLVANAEQMLGTGLASEGSVFLDFLPFFHTYGMTVLMNGGFASGATQVIMPRFDPEECLELVERHGVTSLFVVPPALLALANVHDASRHDTLSLRYILSGAAPLSPEIAETASRLFNVPVLQGYGMTETTAAANVDLLEGARPPSVGKPLADTEEKIVSLEDGRELGYDEEGELCVRGPQIMLGYWGKPEETANTVTADGWLHTGDIARADEDGYVYIVDRRKELIKYKGFQVAPAELEALLLEHPAVLDVAVIGKPDARSGEVPKAFVLPRPGHEPDSQELMRFVADRVAPHKRLREVEFVEVVPRSLSGKILRRELIERERARTVAGG
ncbi:MAG: AMP-binding protein [Dehalococcoidia bacterium]